MEIINITAQRLAQIPGSQKPRQVDYVEGIDVDLIKIGPLYSSKITTCVNQIKIFLLRHKYSCEKIAKMTSLSQADIDFYCKKTEKALKNGRKWYLDAFEDVKNEISIRQIN